MGYAVDGKHKAIGIFAEVARYNYNQQQMQHDSIMGFIILRVIAILILWQCYCFLFFCTIAYCTTLSLHYNLQRLNTSHSDVKCFNK